MNREQKKIEYELNFGFDFIRSMDERYHIDQNGFDFGTGVQTAVMQLYLKNPIILEDIILASTHHLKSIPSKKDIEAWVIEKAEKDELEVVFDDFLENLKTAPLLRNQVKQLVDELEKTKK